MARGKLVGTIQPRSGTASFKLIADILRAGVWEFPNDGKYNGNGGPGRLLEDLLNIKMTEFSKQHDLYVIIEKVVNEYDRVRSRGGKCERD